jgi:hypothetical protein
MPSLSNSGIQQHNIRVSDVSKRSVWCVAFEKHIVGQIRTRTGFKLHDPINGPFRYQLLITCASLLDILKLLLKLHD